MEQTPCDTGIFIGVCQLSLIKPNDIGAVLRRLNNKKNSGYAGIPNFVLRKLDHRIWKKWLSYLIIASNSDIFRRDGRPLK